MVPEASLEETEAGLVPAGAGWFVLDARRARWIRRDRRGHSLPFTGWGLESHGVASSAVDERASQRGCHRHQAACHVALRRANELIGRVAKFISDHHSRADPDYATHAGLVHDLRPLEGVFDRLNATIEHPEMLAGIVVREVLAQVALGARRGNLLDHGGSARAQALQLGFQGLEAGRGHGDGVVLSLGHWRPGSDDYSMAVMTCLMFV